MGGRGEGIIHGVRVDEVGYPEHGVEEKSDDIDAPGGMRNEE
jgi:hypothetical protein